MRGKKYKAREDEEDLESSCAVSGVSVGDEEGVPVSPVPDDDMLSSSRSPRERIQYSQSSQRSALKELYKQFDEMKAELHKTLVGEDDEYEDEVGVPFSPEHDGDMSSSTRNPRERIRYLQYCQKSALKELYKQFDDMKAELDETKQEKMQLAERNHRVQERFKRAKEGEESRKKDLEESQNKLQQVRTIFAAANEECDKICDQQGAAPQLSNSRKYVLKVFEVNNLLNCSICFEPWTDSGDHTACSLSCGHFFGKLCITKWILGNESDDSARCPQCSKGTTLSDIRDHCVSQIYEGGDEA